MKKILFIIISFSLIHIIFTYPFFNLLVENNTKLNEKSILYIYGHLNPDTDSIVSSLVFADYLKKLGNTNHIIPCRPGKLNKETKYVFDYFNVEPPVLITDLSGADEVILVDHNSPSQSLDFENANIIGIIDHHAISDFKSENPINIITKAVGSTCTILYELYRQNNINITKEIAGLMISAIISDTLLLKSPITTQEDIEAITFLSEYIDIDYKNFGYNLLMAGTDISDLSEYDIINLDSKAYKVNGYMIQIAFINSVNISEILKRKEKLLEEIDKFIEKKKLHLFAFVIVDIINIDSTLLIRGSLSKVIETAFNVEIQDNEVFLKGISSRKKQVYPNIAKVINKLPNLANTHDRINYNIVLILGLLLLI